MENFNKMIHSTAGVPLVIVLCGLPARGKSYLARKLACFLRWRGFATRIFNAGDYRRRREGPGQTADFFSTSNESGSRERENTAKAAFDDLLAWIECGGQVALFDATNTTVNRRKILSEVCQLHGLHPPMFIESVCTDEKLLERNYQMKLQNDDYKNVDPDIALADFKKRVELYASRYEPVGDTQTEEDYSFLKVYNVGKRLVVNNCNGWLKSQVVTILQNFHITPRRIFITKHGESIDSLQGILGSDSSLTQNGSKFSHRFQNFIEDEIQLDEKKTFTAFCSGMRRSLETIEPLLRKKYNGCGMINNEEKQADNGKNQYNDNVEVICSTALNEINPGLFSGYLREELEVQFKEEFRKRQDNKVVYRYPGGESYLDVIQRLHPIVLELERQKSDVIVISHTVPIRLLLAYFKGEVAEATAHQDIPMHTVFEVRPEVFGCQVIEHNLVC